MYKKQPSIFSNTLRKNQVYYFVAVFVALGTAALLYTQALTPSSVNTVLEAESGVLAGPAKLVNDQDNDHVTLFDQAVSENKCAGASPLLGAAQSMRCIHYDEFLGTELDRSKWGVADKYSWWSYNATQDRHTAWALERNVTVSDGMLRLTAKREAYQGHNGITDWTTGEIASHSRSFNDALDGADVYFKFKYGYVESRLKIPPGRGFMPAFWLVNNEGEPFSEYEIVEFIHDGNEAGRLNHPNHFRRNPNDPLDERFSSPGGNYNLDYGVDLTADYHTYGLMWQPDQVAWYFDGRLVKKLTASPDLIEWYGPDGSVVNRVADQQAALAISDSNMTLWYNLYVGWDHDCSCGYNAGPDATTPSPSVMSVDYIRVWQ